MPRSPSRDRLPAEHWVDPGYTDAQVFIDSQRDYHWLGLPRRERHHRAVRVFPEAALLRLTLYAGQLYTRSKMSLIFW